MHIHGVGVNETLESALVFDRQRGCVRAQSGGRTGRERCRSGQLLDRLVQRRVGGVSDILFYFIFHLFRCRFNSLNFNTCCMVMLFERKIVQLLWIFSAGWWGLSFSFTSFDAAWAAWARQADALAAWAADQAACSASASRQRVSSKRTLASLSSRLIHYSIHRQLFSMHKKAIVRRPTWTFTLIISKL